MDREKHNSCSAISHVRKPSLRLILLHPDTKRTATKQTNNDPRTAQMTGRVFLPSLMVQYMAPGREKIHVVLCALLCTLTALIRQTRRRSIIGRPHRRYSTPPHPPIRLLTSTYPTLLATARFAHACVARRRPTRRTHVGEGRKRRKRDRKTKPETPKRVHRTSTSQKTRPPTRPPPPGPFPPLHAPCE